MYLYARFEKLHPPARVFVTVSKQSTTPAVSKAAVGRPCLSQSFVRLQPPVAATQPPRTTGNVLAPSTSPPSPSRARSRATMPSRTQRLVRRRPLSERIQALLNPMDFYLWLSEEIQTFDWDSKHSASGLGSWQTSCSSLPVPTLAFQSRPTMCSEIAALMAGRPSWYADRSPPLREKEQLPHTSRCKCSSGAWLRSLLRTPTLP